QDERRGAALLRTRGRKLLYLPREFRTRRAPLSDSKGKFAAVFRRARCGFARPLGHDAARAASGRASRRRLYNAARRDGLRGFAAGSVQSGIPSLREDPAVGRSDRCAKDTELKLIRDRHGPTLRPPYERIASLLLPDCAVAPVVEMRGRARIQFGVRQ